MGIGGPRQRVILAMLVINRGRTVSIDSLTTAVWGELPPTTARTQIAICVSALRKAFIYAGVVHDLIATSPPGYVLNCLPDQLDTGIVDRFVKQADAASAAGRFVEAAVQLRHALQQWRGEPFAGIRSAPVEAAAAGLEERRLLLVEELFRIELALGHRAELIGEIGGFVERHPFRERLRGQLMVALHGGGRQVEALAAYRQFSRVLADELGLDPGPDLRDLHAGILRGEPLPDRSGTFAARPVTPPEPPASPARGGHTSIGQSRVRPVMLPPENRAFAGREVETATLDELWRHRAKGRTHLVVVTGAAGMGKTSLALHWAYRVADQFPDGVILISLAGDREDGQSLPPALALRRMLFALDVPAELITDDLEELSAIWRGAVRQRRVLLVLDNALSADQIRPLLPASAGCAVVVTSRHRLEDLLVREGGHAMSLSRLPHRAAVAALDAAGVVADAPTARRLAELCDGQPLALQIAAARLASRSHWTVADLVERLADEGRRLAELRYGAADIRSGYAWSFARLSPAAATLLRRMSVLGVRDVPPWVAAGLLQVDLGEGEDALSHLMDAHCVRFLRTDAAGQPRFHLPDLARLYARERALLDEPREELDRALERTRQLARSLATRAQGCARDGGAASAPLSRIAVDGLLRWPYAWLHAERATLETLVADRPPATRAGIAR